ncbi:sulfite exporter TauE/SafE family protein [Blastococcus sp. SYSU D00813]
MSVLEIAFLVAAGVGGGLSGSIAGLASLVSYPALLATGIPPVTANVTNTVALVLNSVGSVSASRPELRGQGRRLLPLLGAAVLGGAAGAALLLSTPSDAFEKIVPFLIALAAVAILVQRPPRELAAEGAAAHAGHPGDPRWLPAAVFGIGIYGGYFGAAAGVLLLATLLLATGDGVPRSNALKNAILGVANAVAAVGYVVLTDVAWSAALPLAAGLFLGGLLGPRIVRRSPPAVLRRVIALAGLGLAVYLGVEAFG